jgi:micrococcal nuclease
MKRRKQRGFSWPRLTPKKLVSLVSAAVLGIFYTFFSPVGSALYGTVTRVVDGDTIHVTVGNEERTVRLIGVDAPETVHPKKTPQFYGKEASDFTKRNLLNKAVWLEYDVSPKDRYDRHLAYVWLGEPGAGEDAIRRDMFNARLILEGYGKVMTIQPNSKYASIFERFQQEARTAKKGLWRKR